MKRTRICLSRSFTVEPRCSQDRTLYWWPSLAGSRLQKERSSKLLTVSFRYSR